MTQKRFKGIAASGDGVGLSVKVNTGSVDVALQLDDNVTKVIKTYTADANEVFNPCGIPFLITANGDATFTIGNAFGVSDEVPPPELKTFDTIVGVGDSITQGEFALDGGQFSTPYRGVNWVTGATFGTTLQNMIDNVTNFTSLASGRTLFIVRAGINDCNALLSVGGTVTGSSGIVTSWDDLSQEHRESTLGLYRQLVDLLKPHGEVALSTITYCNAKGILLQLPDKGRNLHSGSWNDNTTVPLCQELTPEWFDFGTGRPKLDYYKITYDNPEILDDDNLHFYNDRTYVAPVGQGYVDGPGSYTLRQETIRVIGENTTMPSTPYDSNLFSDRVLINVGFGVVLQGRPSFQRWANNLEISSANEQYQNLKSYNGDTSISMQASLSNNGVRRSNLFTSDQVWDEGVGDRNSCCSSIAAGASNTHILTFSGLGEGEVSLVGIYSSQGAGGVYNPADRTIFEVTDDNGMRTVEVGSSLNGDIVTIQDCVAKLQYDCRTSGTLSIRYRPATGSTHGTISSICFDLK